MRVLSQHLISGSSSLLLKHAISTSELRSALSCCWCIGPILHWLSIVLRLCSGSSCLCHLICRWITLAITVSHHVLIIVVVVLHLINRMLANVQLIITGLILESLELLVASNTCFFEILWLHELLVWLSLRLHVHRILNKAKMIGCSSLFLQVLACSWGWWNLVTIAIDEATSPASDRPLSWYWRLRLHKIWRINLIGCQHLYSWITQSRPNGRPTINTRGCHACHPRHGHVTASALHKITHWLPIVPLVCPGHIHHRHRCARLLPAIGTARLHASVILLQQRMVALLMRASSVDVVLSGVTRLDVGQEAIVALEQLIAGLAGENQVLLVGAAAHHYFWGGSLVLLGTRILLLLWHGGLHVQALTAINTLLVITWHSLWCSVLLVLFPEHLVGSTGSDSCIRHRVVELRLLVDARVLLHFGLQKKGMVVKTLC